MCKTLFKGYRDGALLLVGTPKRQWSSARFTALQYGLSVVGDLEHVMLVMLAPKSYIMFEVYYSAHTSLLSYFVQHNLPINLHTTH